MHLLLLAALIGLGVPYAVKLAFVAALGAHGLRRRPRSETRVLLQQADGHWGLPELGHSDLTLARGTRYTVLWARLVLRGDGAMFDILLLKDQFDQASWRGLQARLRSSAARGGSSRQAGGGAGALDLR